MSVLRALLFGVAVIAWPLQAVHALDLEPRFDALATNPVWIKLGRYESSWTTASGWRSAIHSDDFFLGPNGHFDPRAELEATIAAFRAPPPGGGDRDPRCRFPARRIWLERVLGAGAVGPSPVSCPAFEAWTRNGSVESISIVFATGYLGNPASYYGHTLLKFNYRGETGPSRLLDVAVNYGAIVERKDGPVLYIIKALTGGYDGGFSHIHYYFHNHNYAENELRDLWEYRLALRADQVEMIVAHAWEVLGKRYTYEFLRNNCAFRMAEVVEIADGVSIVPDRWPWIVPQAVVQAIAAASNGGYPLLADARRTPSRQSRFYERYDRLSAGERAAFRSIALGTRGLHEEEFDQLSVGARHQILDALMDYYQFAHAPLDQAPHAIRTAYAAALAARFALPPGETTIGNASSAPHAARPPGWMQAGVGHHGRYGFTTTIRLRPAYYDALDGDGGHVPNSSLTMADTQIDLRPDRASLRRLEIVGVDSSSPGRSGLSGDDGRIWKVRAGLEPDRLDCDRCIVARLQGDIGISRSGTSGAFAAAYVGGALQSGPEWRGRGFVRAGLDMVLRPRSELGARMSVEHRAPVAGTAHPYQVVRAEARIGIAGNFDFRANFEFDRTRWFGIGIGRYW